MTFSIYDPLGIKLFNRLRVDFSHLYEHKFRHRCRNFANLCIILMNELKDIDNSITSKKTNKLLRIIL